MKTHLIWFGVVALAVCATYMIRDVAANKELERANRECTSQLESQQNNFELLLETLKPDTVKLPPVLIKVTASLSREDSTDIAEAFSKVFQDSTAIKELLAPKQAEQRFIAQDSAVTVVGLSEMWFTPLTNEFENRISLEQVIYPTAKIELHDTTFLSHKEIDWNWAAGALSVGIVTGILLTK